MIKKLFIAFLIIFILAGGGVLGYKVYDKIQLENHYKEMILEGNKECSEIYERLSNQIVTINVGNKTVIKRYSELVTLDAQIEFPSIEDSYDNSYDIKFLRNVRTSILYDLIESLYEEPINASITHSYDNGWELHEQYDDYYFDIDEVYQYVDSGLYNGEILFDLDAYLKSADIVISQLYDTFNKVSWLNNFVIRYNGITYFTGEDLASCIHDYELNIDEIDLSEVHNSLKTSFETTGKTVDFYTTNGETVSVKYGTLGKSVNWDKEKIDILEAIQTHTSMSKDAPYLYGYDDMESEYIEISLTDQHVWHYKDNILCCESDCVTGLKNKMDTPKGVYYISECIPGKYLVGDDYKVWVDRWMRLTNSGIGLHDASSRKAFGGNIYTYNGSHGCINLPPKYAYSLFAEMRNGVAVIIY